LLTAYANRNSIHIKASSKAYNIETVLGLRVTKILNETCSNQFQS